MASSTTFSSLTNDILFEIFIYLPLTSIYRCKSVSKVWLSFISNPNFITKWLEINSKSLPWIQYHSDTPHYGAVYPFKFGNAYPDSPSTLISRNDYGFSFEFLANEKLLKGDELFLLGSSNGLVLCFSKKLDGEGSYHVCNPLTQKWVTIPPPPRRHAGQYEYNGIFCDNPLSASCCYKVVCILKFMSTKRFNVDMFDSDLGEWISFEVLSDHDVSSVFRWGSVALNGVLYFMEGYDRMLVYNLNQNKGGKGHQCSLINLPGPSFCDYKMLDGPYGRGIFHSRTLGESEGWICYARSKVTDTQIFVSVWVLVEENWQVLDEDILVPDTLTEICYRTFRSREVRVAGFSPVSRNIVLLSREHLVWWYNIQTNCFEELDRSSLLANKNTGRMGMCQSFVLKTMPTILPPPSWIDEDGGLPPKHSPSNVVDGPSVAELFLSE